jgi:transposase-like protein
MSTKRKNLADGVSTTVETIDRLRQVLSDFKQAIVKLAKLTEGGEPGVSALGNLNAPLRRRTVTEAMEEFEVARHQMRVALFALCLEEGASTSEIGRALGISRQLASRLALEIEEAGS